MGNDRKQVIDYSIPVGMSRPGLYGHISQPAAPQLNVTAFVKIFRPLAWAASLGIAVLVMGLVAEGDAVLSSRSLEASPRPVLSAFLTIWFPTTSGVGTAQVLRKPWTRLVIISSTLLILMLVTVYCCDLTAYMTAQPSDALESCQDIVDRDYELLLFNGSSTIKHYFEEFPFMHDCRDRIRYVNGSCVVGCMARLLEGRQRSLYLSPDTIVHPEMVARRSFLPSKHLPWGITFRHNSEFKELFNHQLLKMIEGGALQKLNYQWIYSHLEAMRGDSRRPSSNPISLDQLFLPTLILLGGFSVSVGAALFELLLGKVKARKSNPARARVPPPKTTKE